MRSTIVFASSMWLCGTIGRPMPRFEDLRLVRGNGRYSDDISMPDQVYAVFVRSPHAHAKIKRIDAAGAKAMPGVIAVYTGKDLHSTWAAPMPCATMPPPATACWYAVAVR